MKKPTHPIERAALGATAWIGSVPSLVTHSIIFLASFAAVVFGLLPFERMLLVLTTIVSLEAIYLSIFIQMSVNRASSSIEEVEHDIDEIQEDIDEIQEDVDEIQEDVDEMQEDIEEIHDDDAEEEKREQAQGMALSAIHAKLEQLLGDIEHLQTPKRK